MNTLEAIKNRKSTRKFLVRKVKRRCIEEILFCGIQAPSPKNDQPWHFCVFDTEDKKNKIADILKNALQALKNENESKGIQRRDIDEAFSSVNVLKEASAIVFVYLDNSVYSAHDDGVRWSLHAKDVECTHILAVGAAIENMLLAAEDMGINTLWLGDIFFAYHELTKFITEEGCLMAAVALGYGDRTGIKPPRRMLREKVRWIS